MKQIYVMGSVNMDLVIECDSIPKQGETTIGKNFIANAGGKGANQAVAVAKSGMVPILIAGIGNDHFGRQINEGLAQYGVDVSNIITFDHCNTGIASIIVSEGDNRIILDLGANLSLQYQYCEKALNTATKGDILIVQLETGQDNIISTVRYAKTKGMTIVLNPAPANRDTVLALADSIDYLVPNQTELHTITQMPTDTMSDILDACQSLIDKGIKYVIVTLGARGCVVMSNNGYAVVPSMKIISVDSTAAGDTFVGYFCSGLANDRSVQQCCKLATAAAALTCTRRGAQCAIPLIAEVECVSQ